MAITQDYVAYATGNDYKGASFVDGAFTVADMTLTKAGAFAASKVNHWLYLTDNGSGQVTPGYYRIATVTSNDAVVLATSPKSGATDPTDVKCTQHAGTTLLPWRSLQGGFDLCTRNATDGNQINLKAGTAQVNAAPLDLTTFIAGGALSAAGPLIIRGYTTAANDGGMGEIDCGGATMFAATTYDHVMLIDLEMHTFGNNNGIVLDQQCLIYRCEFHKGASSPSSKTLATLAGSGAIVGCYGHDSGAGIDACISLPSAGVAIGNYLVPTAYRGILCGANVVVSGNIFKGSSPSFQAIIYDGTGPATVIGNVAYNSAAGTQMCLYLGNAAGRYAMMCINNIIVGQSGAGGKGIGTVNTGAGMVGSNAFYNNTANYGFADVVFVDETSNDVTLAADPFTDAANGDFSLTAAAKLALADKGFPTQYLGAHANTDSHLNIGAIQLAAVTCDYPAEADVEFGVTYDTGAKTGTFVVPAVADVQSAVTYGAAAEFTGTFAAPAVADVQSGVQYGGGGTEYTGTFTAPDAADVRSGETYGGSGTEYTGTLDLPAEADVQSGVTYDGLTKTGTFVAPAVGDVEAGVGYGAAGTEYTGTFAVPAEADVEAGVSYGEDGTEFTGTYEASSTVNAITTGNVTTYQGDDYDTADGRQLDWTVASTATLTGGTVAVIIPGVATYTGSVVNETTIRLELTAAQTAAIPVGRRKYQVIVTQTVALGSDKITVVEGTWTSNARVTE